MALLKRIYIYWAVLLFAAVIVQVGAAAYGAFNAAEKIDDRGVIGESAFDDGFDVHGGFGYAIFLGAVLLFLMALVARAGRRQVLWALSVPLLVAIQIALAWGGKDEATVGIFHGVVALLIFALTGFVAHRAWREHVDDGDRH